MSSLMHLATIDQLRMKMVPIGKVVSLVMSAPSVVPAAQNSIHDTQSVKCGVAEIVLHTKKGLE